MITNISPSVQNVKSINNTTKSTPSFGFARLNSLGRESADTFGYQNNSFLNSDMFRKQGLFRRSTLSTMLSKGENFKDLCSAYGCSKNAKTNAEFITTQILSGKSREAIQKLPKEDVEEGLTNLYFSNYDNPELNLKQTKDLLNFVKEYITPEDFIKHAGILAEGAERK